MAPMSRPVSRSVFASASTIEPKVGCEVLPESESIATSTQSTPLAAAARIVEIAAPEVSWVWKWIGSSTASFSAGKSLSATAAVITPAMSLIPRIWAPAASISFAIFT